MNEYYEFYSKEMEPAIPSEGKITSSNWRALRGQKKYANRSPKFAYWWPIFFRFFLDYVEFFTREIETTSPRLCVSTCWEIVHASYWFFITLSIAVVKLFAGSRGRYGTQSIPLSRTHILAHHSCWRCCLSHYDTTRLWHCIRESASNRDWVGILQLFLQGLWCYSRIWPSWCGRHRKCHVITFRYPWWHSKGLATWWPCHPFEEERRISSLCPLSCRFVIPKVNPFLVKVKVYFTY